jgi:hypothetical protein
VKKQTVKTTLLTLPMPNGRRYYVRRGKGRAPASNIKKTAAHGLLETSVDFVHRQGAKPFFPSLRLLVPVEQSAQNTF